MSAKLFVVLTAVIVSCSSQRSPYAGRSPIGYPTIIAVSPPPASDAGNNDLGDRFGDDDQLLPSTTTQRLPVEALGDRALVNRLSKLPIDQQPFWYLNWRALEQQRRNPQTYPQKANTFAGSFTFMQ